MLNQESKKSSIYLQKIARHESRTICHGLPCNLANWPAQFGKIRQGKLWSL